MTKAVELAQVASTGVSEAFKNRIINGAMVIDQRNAGASITPTNGQYGLDRWAFNATAASKYTSQQNQGSVTPAVGFRNYLGVTSSSAYSVTSGDLFSIYHNIEGFNTADLMWGTANAQTVTLSFWVRSSLTGTFSGSLTNVNGDRSYVFTYTVSSANTWEQKSITIAGDTTGTWNTTNSSGIRITFSLGAGSSFSSGTSGSWIASGAYSLTGSVSVVGTNGATFYITGVQLEVGSSATNFEYRPYGTELALCQRYYETGTIPIDGLAGQYAANAYNGNQNGFNCIFIPFTVKKRTSPTVPTVTSNGSWVIAGDNAFSATSNHTFVANNISVDAVRFISNRISGNSTPTAGNVYMWEANFTYTASAEL